MVNKVNTNIPAQLTQQLVQTASRYIPAPSGASALGSMFSKALSGAAEVGGSLVGGVQGNVYGDLKELLNLQVETQAKMQSISMLSNIERSKHESRMAAIRNVRTS